MKTIYKYALKIEDVQRVSMPVGSQLLTVQIQKDEVQLWAMVNTALPMENRVIEIFGTGNPIEGIDDHRIYISTFQLKDGALDFHAFEYIGS